MIKPDFNKFTKKRQCLFGAMLGDAIGVPFEFKHKHNIIQEYINNPNVIPYSYKSYKDTPLGVYSDDFSQILCVEECLNNHVRDFNTEMLLWSDGKYWVDRELFDIGNQTKEALTHYHLFGKILLSPNGSGNGGTMRLAPLAFVKCNLIKRHSLVKKYSELTHNNKTSLDCGNFFVTLLDLLANHALTFEDAWINSTILSDYTPPKSARTSLGSGYVVDTMNSIKYCIEHSNSFGKAIGMAIGLGNDTDTTALHVGAVAALCFGLDDVSDDWIEFVQPSLNNKYVKELFDIE